MSYGMTSPLAYNSYIGSPDVSPFAQYNQVQLLIADGYKEQQYWLSVYNHAQQFGLNNTSIAEITTQIQRVSQKISTLKDMILVATQGYMDNENKVNQGISDLFKTQASA